MSRAKSLAIAMYVGAALAGAATALAVDRMTARTARGVDPRPTRARFFDQMGFTPAQRDTVARLMDERDRRFKALMDRSKAVLDPIRAAQDSIDANWRQEFTRLLTPEQKANYDQMQAARRERERAARGGDTKR
ncbi:MAG: hypothetical protein IT356_09475 [Gemmatimonadaceae bacterium]|nr:hypothetical protein [Gemmatimonadaceae bacterium]